MGIVNQFDPGGEVLGLEASLYLYMLIRCDMVSAVEGQ